MRIRYIVLIANRTNIVVVGRMLPLVRLFEKKTLVRPIIKKMNKYVAIVTTT